jgi:hypothetical protein
MGKTVASDLNRVAEAIMNAMQADNSPPCAFSAVDTRPSPWTSIFRDVAPSLTLGEL